ncbi:MAG TPA: hypothetical protein VKR82_09495 [Candidatus Acidoferrales bacterium]|nr:hypothetical protein [Candidatus Acidoferrales bacterium]
MTRAAKITYSIAILLGLIAGATTGYEWTSVSLEFYDSITTYLAPATLADYSYLQYKHADVEHARPALQNYANFLEEMEKIHSDWSQRKHLSFAYARLAMLEEAANDPQRSSILMAKARYWYALDSGGKEPSDSDMKKAVKILDENGLH